MSTQATTSFQLVSTPEIIKLADIRGQLGGMARASQRGEVTAKRIPIGDSSQSVVIRRRQEPFGDTPKEIAVAVMEDNKKALQGRIAEVITAFSEETPFITIKGHIDPDNQRNVVVTGVEFFGQNLSAMINGGSAVLGRIANALETGTPFTAEDAHISAEVIITPSLGCDTQPA